MDLETALSGTEFGMAKTPPHEREPERAESQETPRDAEPTEAKTEASTEPVEAKSHTTDDDDGDDRDLDVEPSLDGLKRALKSERSITRQQRKALKEALGRLEAQQHQVTGHVAALHQQMAARTTEPAKAPEQKQQPDEWDPFLAKGPLYVKEVIEREFREREAKAREVHVARQRARIDAQEQAFVQSSPEAAKTLAYFKQMAAADPSLSRQFEMIADGVHPGGHTDPVKWAHDVAKASLKFAQYGSIDEYEQALRKQWESERAGGGQASEPRGEARRTPLTLAGHRGGGSSVTPAEPEPPALRAVLPF